jgi:ABC-type uncharacterized transport system substrate-binding protein
VKAAVFGSTLLAAIVASAAPEAHSDVSHLPRVVVVSNGDEANARPFVDRFDQGMKALGHVEGRTFRLEILYANLEPARADSLIKQAVASRPRVIIVTGLTNARRARHASGTVPIVVATGSDLVNAGVVNSLAKPGGNITGITDLADEVALKRLDLIKEMLPNLKHLALLNNPDFPAAAKIESRVRSAAGPLGITVAALHARDRASLGKAIESLKTSRAEVLLVGGDALFAVNAQQLIEAATAARTPVVHYWPGTAEMGAVLSYHADIHKNWERAAFYVDRILKGARPGDLPVEEPTRYELVVNRKAAKALGVEVPQKLLFRADRVLE